MAATTRHSTGTQPRSTTKAKATAPNRVSKASATPKRGKNTSAAPKRANKSSAASRPQEVPETPSARAISPDVIEETPPSRGEVQELRERLEDALELLRRRRSRTPSRRRHRYEEGSGSEEVDRPRVSFLHSHSEGKRPFIKIHQRYRAVDVRYFKQIYDGTFRPEHLTKLASSYTNRLDKDDDVQEAVGLNQLLRCFEVYGQAICHFCPPTVAIRLQEALSDYRVRLSDLSVHYRFDSIREYHYAFMGARILCGQDDPIAWITEDNRCSDLLIRKTPTTGNSTKQHAVGHAVKSSSSGGTLTCNSFNAGRCTREHCKYSHICSNCQQNHPAITCPKPHASNTNLTPLGSRITKPE